MSVIRWIISLLLSVALFLLLLITPLYIALYQTFNTPDKFLTAIDNSMAYGNIVEIAIDQINSETGEQSDAVEEAFPLTDEEIREIADQIFPPEWLKESTEEIVLGVYDWLEGETERPIFYISLEERKPQFESAIRENINKRLDSYDTCSPDIDYSADGFSPLDEECIPPGIDFDAEIDKLVEQVLNDDQFWESALIDSSEINISDGFRDAPTIFQSLDEALFILIIIILALPLLIVLVTPNWRSGFSIVSLLLFVTGTLHLLVGLGTSAISNAIIEGIIRESEGDTEQISIIRDLVVPFVSELVNHVGNSLLVSAALILLFAIIGVISLYFMREKRGSHKMPKQASDKDKKEPQLK